MEEVTESTLKRIKSIEKKFESNENFMKYLKNLGEDNTLASYYVTTQVPLKNEEEEDYDEKQHLKPEKYCVLVFEQLQNMI